MHKLRTTYALFFTLFLTAPLPIYAGKQSGNKTGSKNTGHMVLTKRTTRKIKLNSSPTTKREKRQSQNRACNSLRQCGCLAAFACGTVVVLEAVKSLLQNN